MEKSINFTQFHLINLIVIKISMVIVNFSYCWNFYYSLVHGDIISGGKMEKPSALLKVRTLTVAAEKVQNIFRRFTECSVQLLAMGEMDGEWKYIFSNIFQFNSCSLSRATVLLFSTKLSLLTKLELYSSCYFFELRSLFDAEDLNKLSSFPLGTHDMVSLQKGKVFNLPSALNWKLL